MTHQHTGRGSSIRPGLFTQYGRFAKRPNMETHMNTNTTRVGNLLYLSPAQLKTHPKNMRRFYPHSQVEEMAQSIKAYHGLVQALQVVPDGAPDTYYVAVGNLRLAGARQLGDECPPLKAEVISQSQAEQLLTMVIENTTRFDVDPVSEALHYHALQQEGLSIADICDRTGQYHARVTGRLELLKLDEPIQQLVAEGKLSHDPRVVKALLSIPDPEARIQLAQKLAASGARIKTIEAACAKLAEQLVSKAASKNARLRSGETGTETRAPMLAHAGRKAKRAAPAPKTPAPVDALREAADAMCQVCDVRTDALKALPEPAWALVVASAERTCANCNLRDLENVCASCPGVELLRAIIEKVKQP